MIPQRLQPQEEPPVVRPRHIEEHEEPAGLNHIPLERELKKKVVLQKAAVDQRHGQTFPEPLEIRRGTEDLPVSLGRSASQVAEIPQEIAPVFSHVLKFPLMMGQEI